MDLLWKDIRYGFHSLLMNPGFALIAILTLAIGIGATTAIFSVVNGVLLQPLPLRDPARLVMVWERQYDEPDTNRNVSPANFLEWAKESRLFSSVGSHFDWEISLTGQAEPALVRAGLVNGALFPTLGVKPLLGRYIQGSADGNTDTVLSYALWQSRFGGDPHVLGKRLELDGSSYTIAGVMPRDFLVPDSRAALWIPSPIPTEEGSNRGRYLHAVARLAPGVTIEQANAGMKVVAARLATAFPQHNTGWSAAVIPVHEEVVGNVRRALLIVLAAVALLLLIGCVNIANLLLSRASGRSKEMAVRAALGASRAQLIRQLLTESVLLALIAGVLGVFIAIGATNLLVRFTPDTAMMPRVEEIAIDGRVLAVTALITLATGIFFGLAPAIEASRTNLQSGLTSTSRGSTQDRRGKAFRKGLVIAEVALATVLLIGAGLLIKSFSRLEQVDPGVRPEGVLTMRVVLPPAYEEKARRRAVVTQLLEQTSHIPGVKRAGAISNMDFTGAISGNRFAIEGAPVPPVGQEPASDIRAIAGDYFQAMGIPVLAGRTLDTRDPERVEFVVNDAFARRYLGDAKSAVGRRLQIEWFSDLRGEVVGVVGSVHAAGLAQDSAPAMYFSYLHDRSPQFTLTLATTGNPLALQAPATRIVHAIDPLIPVSDVATLETLISGTIARPRFNATILALFAALGLLLASMGIYGVLSYSVAQRTQEMGIRMALGADAGNVRRLVVRDGVTVALIGVAVGLAAAVPATRVLAALLYGVDSLDMQVFALVAATLTAVALAASYLPARRATRLDPMTALRPE
ncbi:MAG TPA: ABC transporter permease [Gemmatimonadaceae bacterium]|nr:ABC transporter permease [Gemmatimonadaceae bacterium]